MVSGGGFEERFAWPSGKSMLGNAAFVDLAVKDFALRHPQVEEITVELEGVSF